VDLAGVAIVAVRSLDRTPARIGGGLARLPREATIMYVGAPCTHHAR
jgi:hypothetical protein